MPYKIPNTFTLEHPFFIRATSTDGKIIERIDFTDVTTTTCNDDDSKRPRLFSDDFGIEELHCEIDGELPEKLIEQLESFKEICESLQEKISEVIKESYESYIEYYKEKGKK